MLYFLDTSYHVFQHETDMCRSLLEQYAGKMNYAIPSYICNKQDSGVGPFICTVEIGGIKYVGATAHTNKAAELKAAQTALLAIQGIFFFFFLFQRGVFLIQL